MEPGEQVNECRCLQILGVLIHKLSPCLYISITGLAVAEITIAVKQIIRSPSAVLLVQNRGTFQT